MPVANESILNVDDYAPGRYARTKILRQAGFIVREAATGREALASIADKKPSLILLDVNLPDVGGFDVCRQIRQNPENTTISIVHISASSIENYHQVDGLEAGADSYLVEPIDPLVLIATVRAHLRARKAEEALRASNEELQWFAYRAAHDLNEPLRTITAHTQLLESRLKGKLDEHTMKSIEFVVQAGERMRVLIDDLLRFASVTDKTETLQPVDCEKLLERVLENLGAAIRGSDARITHDPLPVLVAAEGLEEVFQNLIGNAIKYSREGVQPEIHVTTVRDAIGDWLVSVRDNGMGIAPANCSDIFTAFRRLHGRDIPGSGLGLAVCRKIIEAHGGTIWVDSKVGEGSIFSFTIPQKK